MNKTVGIAITTRNRPELLKYTLRKTREAFDGFVVVVDDHSNCMELNEMYCEEFNAVYLYNRSRYGIPRSKDRGFRALKTLDYQFWFDDDCFPLPGWLDRMTDAMDYQGHLLLLKPWTHIEKIQDLAHDLVEYNSGTACFMSFRKDMYKDVTGFHTGFPVYGHWHNDLSEHLAKYGYGAYVSVKDVDKYLYSFDLNKAPADFRHGFESSMSEEERKTNLKQYYDKHKEL